MQNNVEQDVDNSCCFHIVNNERGTKCILDIYSSLQYAWLQNILFDYANSKIPMTFSMPC